MWILAEIEVAKIIFLSALMLTSGWLLVRTRRQTRRTTKPAGPSPRSKRESEPPDVTHQLEAPADVRRWEAEMRELVCTLSAQLDGKIGVLERLIRDAEQPITRLEELSKRAARLTGGEPTSIPPPHGLAHQADRMQPGEPVLRAAAPAARRHEEIYALADSGLTSAAIAARIGSPVGEVELILGLRQTRR